MKVVGRVAVVGQLHHDIFEGEQHPWVDLEGQMQVEWAAAPFLRMQVDFPRLSQRVGLDEVTLVVHVEAVVDRVVLQFGHETGDVDHCHPATIGAGRAGPRTTVARVNDDAVLAVLHDAATAVGAVLEGLPDWGLAGTRAGQYRSDLAADAAALAVLERAGFGVLSEESGLHHGDRPVVVVLDPVDGSTNAAHGLPWFATSLCAVDASGPLAAVVVNQATGVRYEAVRGGGARRDGRAIRPSAVTMLDEALVGLSGLPPAHLGWRQFRALGAAALDLCAVAEGALDGYVDCLADAHGPWDYLGGMLVCLEAGAAVADAGGRDLVALEHGARRTPVAAASAGLLEQLLASRNRLLA